MLTDSSLINTIVLSGISNIRYKTYVESFPKSILLSFLTCEGFHTHPSYIESPGSQNAIINAYKHLIQLNIPATWHIISNQKPDKDMVSLELWLFWFDNKHTNVIENDDRLKELHETKVGSFNWNQMTPKNGLSPTSSPQLNSSTKSDNITLVPGTEYKLFIKSIRNLIQHVMIHTRNAFVLGEFFVFPETYQDHNNVMKDEMANYSSQDNMMSIRNTMLACMYNVYFTTSNLVFQPNTRRLRLRPLASSDLYAKNLKVLLCPTGEHARVLSFYSLPTDLQSKVLDQWAEFYGMPSSLLSQQKDYMPSLITIRTASQDTVIYPSALIFVPTDTKQSPAAVAGMNGIMGLNHGLTEDLGEKTSRMAYYERLKLSTPENDASIDYWSYKNPFIYVSTSVIHALSTIDAKYQQDQMLLHRALVEPVVGSPVMNTKSVIPVNYDSPMAMSGLRRKSDTPSEIDQEGCNMQLTEFAKSRFHIKSEQDQDLEASLLLPDPSLALNSNESLDIGGGSHLSALLNKNLIIDSTDSLPMPTDCNNSRQQLQSMPQQQQQQQQQQSAVDSKDLVPEIIAKDEQILEPPLDDFNLMYDLGGATSSHRADAWDVDDEFQDLDLDVTDADFDFFETPAAAPVTVMPVEPNMLNIMPMEIDTPISADQAKPQEPQPPPPPPPPVEQDTLMVDVQVSDSKPTPSNNDSLFTPFVISNDSTENVSTAATMEVSSYSATPQIVNTTSTLQKRAPYQKSTPEPYAFVPRDFLPVPVQTSVIDAKYGVGGKFMYNPSSDPSRAENKGFAVSKKKESYYSPDYIPAISKKKLIKSKQQAIKAIQIDDSPPVANNENNKNSSRGSSSSSSSGSSSDSSGSDSNSSSSGNGSFTTDENDMSDSSENSSESDIENIDDLENNDTMVEKRLRVLKRFQKSIVYSQLRATPAPLPTGRLQHLDYDTPFAPILSHGSIKPIKWRHSKAMEESLEYLCQQVVLGGYPLAGGLAEVSENGGEIEGEAAKLLVARRNNLMQMTRGVVTHVPSLQADVFNMTHDFKTILQETFNSYDVDNMDIMATTPDGLEPVSYPNGPLLGKIDIKGPLNLQEYYELSESQHQGHSKYGKYQIKKRRPDEPNLDVLKHPDIVVSRHDDYLEGSPKMLPFWEKLGLDPYSDKKQIKYLVVYPDNNDISISIRYFFKSLSNVYEACHLGRHQPGQAGVYLNGLVPVPVSDADGTDSSVRQRLKSYEDTCEILGRYLATDDEQQKHQQHQFYYTVIYIVNPGPHMSSYLDMCRCFYKLKESYYRVAHKSFSEEEPRIALQLMPIDHILRPCAFGGYTMMGMKDIAFSVYSKCFTRVNRKITKENQESWADIYAPAFVLTKPLQRTIKFKLNDIRPYPAIMEQNAVLHMAYCFSYDRRWMSVVWIDDRGELLEYDLFNRKTAYKEAWNRTLEIAKRTAFPWTIVIAKLGLMFNDEYVYWLRYISTTMEHHVTIVAIDLESGLNLHFNACYPNWGLKLQQQNPQQPPFLDAHGKSHIVTSGMSYSAKQDTLHASSKSSAGVSEAQILVLNHRISYSQKRERAYKGILRTEAITEKENWMIPLATGYLINHSLPNKNVNPCMEQFNNEAFVAEIHLLYNQTGVSAYSKLQDIIKRLYALSFINPIPSSHTCIPYHVVLAERLSRLLLVIDDSIK